METVQSTPLGALLVRTRKRAEWTQEALAERAGVSVNTISNLEAGRGHLPRQATLDLLVDALAAALAPPEQPRLRAAFREAARASRAPRAEPPPPLPPPTGTLTFLVCAPAPAATPQPAQARPWQADLPHLAMLLQRVAPAQGGLLVDPPDGPDGAVCVFPRADGAVEAACTLQHALREREVPACLALHTGGAEPGAGDYAGPSRRRAARLARLGSAGQLLLTQATREAAQGRLPEGVRLQGAGRHSLSAVERPQPLHQLLPGSMTGGFPPLRAPAAPPTNLPVQLTSFIGREPEQAAVARLLGQAPLVTLTGAGGCGKTRLALAVAAEQLEAFPDGAWLVELASLGDPALVPHAVAGVLGLREEPGRPRTATLGDHLQSRHLLLVLDNCEHLLVACADLAVLLLRRCPHLQVLATSRERLGIGGEVSYRVPSLALPAPEQQPAAAALAGYAGVRLFVERAQARRQDFVPTEEQVVVAAQICRRLDGMALAIELAAARIGDLPLAAIAARLQVSLGVLADGPWDAPPRQRTLRATLDWGWELLGEPERALLRRLAVFAGGRVADAAEAVCTGDGIDAGAVPGLLDGLVAKSLVQMDETGTGQARYRLLETVRHYALERLDEAGESPVVRERHLDWCVVLAEEAGKALAGSEGRAGAARLRAEHDNLRAALTWSVAEGQHAVSGLRLAGALWRFWAMHGHVVEGRRWLERALATAGDAPAAIQARALLGAGNLAHRHGDYEHAAPLYRQSRDRYRDLGDPRGMGSALNGLSLVAWSQGDLELALRLLEDALALAREARHSHGVAAMLVNIGNVVDSQGDRRRARELYEEALVLLRSQGDFYTMAAVLNNLGDIASSLGDFDRAATLHREVLTLRREAGDPMGIAQTLHNLGKVLGFQGDRPQGKALLQESLDLYRDLGNQSGLAIVLSDLGNLAHDEGDYKQAEIAHTESLALARRLGDKQGMASALIGLGRTLSQLGETAQARASYRDGLAAAWDMGGKGTLACGLEHVAAAVAARGGSEQAARLLGSAECLRETLGAALSPAERVEHDRTMQALRRALSEQTYIAAWAAGRALPIDQAVALALACCSDHDTV